MFKKISIILTVCLLVLGTCASCFASMGGPGEKIRIMCYGDSNTWGFTQRPGVKRWPSDVRWPGVLQKELGKEYTIIEEGLLNFNGRPTLMPLIKSHIPLDVVVIMLGTNDIKVRFHKTPAEVTANVEKLVQMIKLSCDPEKEWYGYGVPKILVIAPVPVMATKNSFAPKNAASRELGPLFKEMAARNGVEFLDAGEYIKVPGMPDGIHLTAEQHRILGMAVAAKIKSMD
ncbi:GDSL-type esterase/lipase family protein, partial [uncultured Anaerovibrio sp.]|uniref:GDSL-type esterase/lipase family protein n=1 Tax=uncultured Anaerovibrio sp. TaxID=361586 RepID=UPI0025DF93C4